MECPACGYINSQVIDSRVIKDGNAIRRRRQCLSCSERFTTYETTEDRLLSVLIQKNSGHGATLFKFKMMLSFLSDTLKILSQETNYLARKMKKYEKAQLAQAPKGKAQSPGAERKKAAVKKAIARKTKEPSAMDTVLKVIKRHKKGANILKLKEKTGFPDKKIRNTLYRATKLGKIRRKERGIYIFS